jgi:glycosyltransferase involved in cell wall biosynthesis
MSWRDLANDLAGGSEVLIDRLAVGMMERGHEVTLLCGGPVGDRPYPVVDLGGTLTQYLRAPFIHHRTVHDRDLLVDVENGIPYFSPLWRREPVLAFVNHVHTDQWGQRFGPVLSGVGRVAEEVVMPRVYRKVPFLAISASTAGSLEQIGVDPDRISILNPGVDLPVGSGVERSTEPLFVCAGRLVPHKRIDLLLRVWESVRPVVGGRLVVIGDGPELESLRGLAGDGVEFAGWVDDAEKWRLLGQAWALIHPSHHEGWGIVIIEAAAVGTPSVGFRVPGVRDAIVDGETGFLVDSEGELAARWIQLTQDSALRGQLSTAARAYAARFGWDTVVREFESIASDALESGRRGRW